LRQPKKKVLASPTVAHLGSPKIKAGPHLHSKAGPQGLRCALKDGLAVGNPNGAGLLRNSPAQLMVKSRFSPQNLGSHGVDLYITFNVDAATPSTLDEKADHQNRHHHRQRAIEESFEPAKATMV